MPFGLTGTRNILDQPAGRQASSLVISHLLSALIVFSLFPGLLVTGSRAQSANAAQDREVLTTSQIDRFRAGSSRKMFGALTFLGGLVLRSDDAEFGGLSGLATADNGQTFLTVSDTGRWFSFSLGYEGDKPVSATIENKGFLLDRNGRPPRRKSQADAEALALTHDGRALVSYEGRSRILSYRYIGGRIEDAPVALTVPRNLSAVRGNKGLEALAFLDGQPDTLITLFEQRLDDKGHHSGWLRTGGKWHAVSLPRRDEFDITDAVFLKTGGLLVLERAFSFSRGVRMHLRYLAPHRIKPGNLGPGLSLLTVNFAYQIDNMEGLTVHYKSDGTPILTLISDDNFKALQRTLLLQFALDLSQLAVESPQPKGRPDP